MARKSQGGGLWLIAAVVALASMCGKDKTNVTSNSTPIASYSSPTAPSPKKHLEKLFVAAKALNQRSSPNGDVIGTLNNGQEVTVYERSGEWSRVSPDDANPRWVASYLLCEGIGCYVSKTTKLKSGTEKQSSHPTKVFNQYFGSNCPCSGNNICIGPRGGHYCITSGGNKRYLPRY